MWTKIKTLNLEDTNAWIRTISPARGIGIDFYEWRINDVDLLEALHNWREELESQEQVKKRRAS